MHTGTEQRTRDRMIDTYWKESEEKRKGGKMLDVLREFAQDLFYTIKDINELLWDRFCQMLLIFLYCERCYATCIGI